MKTLETVLSSFAKQTDARWWVGVRPDVRDGQMAQAIAGQVGLPTAATDPFANGGMIRLNRSEAAHVLAVAGATSLAYGEPLPPSGVLKEAKSALADLNDNAIFFSNGRRGAGPPQGWNPVTTATFDCGIIGFDDACGFVFWVEEED
jgi:hypothetical protein